MSLIQTIKNHITKQTKLGQELLALPSVLSYPDRYKLGKDSVHMECRVCERTPKDIWDTENIRDYGVCIMCEQLQTECQAEAMWDARAECEELGMDWEDYAEMVQERDY